MLDKYPKPKYPPLSPRQVSIEQLLPNARILVERRSKRMNQMPGYEVKPGKRILLVVDLGYDSMVLDALRLAIKEKGGIVDTIIQHSPVLGQWAPAGLDGSVEAEKLELFQMAVAPHWWRDVAVSQKYDLIIEGEGGPIPSTPHDYEHLTWRTPEQWLSNEIPFPPDVQEFIDKKVFEIIQSCEIVRMTDPEGTDITFTNYKDGLRWNYQSHQWGKPMFTSPEEEDAAGVIAGTINHVAFFSHIKVHINNGMVVKVEGGGRYGEVWRKKLEKYADVQMPKYKDRYGRERPAPPGFFYYWETAIGTAVKAFRPVHGFGVNVSTTYERRRVAYIHHGFGPSSDIVLSGELQKRSIPTGNLHVHTLLTTYEGTTAQGKVVLMDKGHLTVLDDPEVRSLASKYGDPDQILSEDWTPAIPGINVEGDYMKDYAENPIAWVRQEQYDRLSRVL